MSPGLEEGLTGRFDDTTDFWGELETINEKLNALGAGSGDGPSTF